MFSKGPKSGPPGPATVFGGSKTVEKAVGVTMTPPPDRFLDENGVQIPQTTYIDPKSAPQTKTRVFLGPILPKIAIGEAKWGRAFAVTITLLGKWEKTGFLTILGVGYSAAAVTVARGRLPNVAPC